MHFAGKGCVHFRLMLFIKRELHLFWSIDFSVDVHLICSVSIYQYPARSASTHALQYIDALHAVRAHMHCMFVNVIIIPHILMRACTHALRVNASTRALHVKINMEILSWKQL